MREQHKINQIRQRLNLPVAQEIISITNYTGLVWSKTIAAEHRVELVNKLQVSSSSRFLYSSDDSFSVAQALLNQYPQYREVKSLYELSGLGQGKSKNPRMPLGDNLVVFGAQDHHILSIQYVDAENSPCIEFFTTDFDKLKMIATDSPFEEVKIYRNGYPIRGMQEAKLEDIDYSGRHPIKISHLNEELSQLLELEETKSHGVQL